MMTQELRQTSTWQEKIVSTIGKVNLWLTAIGFGALLLRVWGFHEMLSFGPTHLLPEGSVIVKTAFYSEWITSGILLLAQGCTGWGLLRWGVSGIRATMVMFCALIFYFFLVCALGIWGSGIVQTLISSQPGIVLDWEMATGYPAAAAVLLYYARKDTKETQQ